MAGAATDAVWIDVLPSMRGFGPALAAGTESEADKVGKATGARFGKALLTGVAVVGAGAALAAKALYNVGATFDDVADTIRVGTGATGKSLDGLVQSAKNVGKQVPAEFDAIGPVIAGLNQRLGLSGATLEKVASQYLEAGRILGEEVDIDKTSAAFSAFGIKGEAVSGAMDQLFRVSQATGVGINELAATAQTAAPAMQALGFSFEDTTALAGNLDKAGLNSSRMMMGLSQSLVKLAKDGEAPEDAFRRTVGEIDGFIKAGNDAAAIDLAGQVFGTRNAPQFIQAIKDGTLNLQDLSSVAGMTNDTILGAAGETADFAEKWQLFKNNVLVALEPIATRVFTALGDGMQWLVEAASRFSSAWSGGDVTGSVERLGSIARRVFDYLKSAGEVVLPILKGAFEGIGTAIAATVGFFREHEGAARALMVVVAVVAAAVVAAWVTQGVVATVNAAKSVAAWFATATASTTASTIQSKSTAQIIVGWLAASASATVNAIKIAAAWAAGVAETGVLMAMYAAQSIASAATSAGAWVAAQARTIASLIATGAGFVAQGAVMLASMAATAAGVVASWVVMGVQSLIRGAQMAAAWVLAMGPVGWVIAAVVGLVALIIANWDKVVAWTKAAWNALVGAIQTAIDWVWNVILKPILTAIQTAWNAVLTAMQWAWNNILKPVWDTISATAGWLWNNILKPIFDGIKQGWDLMSRGMKTIYDNVIKPIWDAFAGAVNWVKDTFKTAVDGISRIWEGLKEALRAPVQWVIDLVWNNGLRKLWNAINNLWGGDDIAEFRFSSGGTYDGPRSQSRGSGQHTAYATGGVLPGYTPGRDVHTFVSPTGGRLLLSGGEAIMRPEFTRAIGTAGVNQLNQLAMKEGVAGLRRALGGDPPNTQAFSQGGVISLPSWLDPSWFSLLPGGGINTMVLQELLDPINNSGGEGGGSWGSMIWGFVKKTASEVWEMAKSLFDSGDGPVAGGGFMDALKWASTQVGKPYIWGGVGPAGYDCSGFMSAITNVIRGKSPYSRVGSTASFPWAGFRPGVTGPFTIGSSRDTGGGIGHMAGTLNGINVESNGSMGVVVGSRARGANDRLFSTRAGLFDDGGLWPPGTAGINLTGGAERVFTPPQDDYFRRFVDLGERGRGQGPTAPPVHLYTPDIPHAIRALRAEEQQREALAPAW